MSSHVDYSDLDRSQVKTGEITEEKEIEGQCYLGLSPDIIYTLKNQ